jgi:hypothetical protein
MATRNITPRKVKLTPTDIPGVFRNKVGTLVDENNVALSFKALRTKDQERFSEALGGGEVTQPAELLKAVALDPRLPLHTRLDAANKAAPYFTPKKVAIQGVEGAAPIGIQDVAALPQKDLDRLEALYAQAAKLLGATQ